MDPTKVIEYCKGFPNESVQMVRRWGDLFVSSQTMVNFKLNYEVTKLITKIIHRNHWWSARCGFSFALN